MEEEPEGEERRFYHQKKKKEVKLWGEKARHAPSTNRFVSRILLKGKFCIVWAKWYNVSGFSAKSLLQG